MRGTEEGKKSNKKILRIVLIVAIIAVIVVAIVLNLDVLFPNLISTSSPIFIS